MKFFVWAALLVAGASHAQITPVPITWKLATGYRAESFHGKNLADFAQEVDSATGGQLKIELHPNNALVKLNDIKTAVQTGRLEAGEIIMSSLVKDMPIAGADSIPFVVSSYAEAMRMWQLQRPSVERSFAQQGIKVLYAAPWPPQGLYSQKPISSEADFRGTQMRTYNASTIRIAELLGAKPVDVPMVEVGKALAEGRMDNMITSSVTGAENKVWSHIKYYYEINAWFPKNIVMVNAQAFNALPTAVQKAVQLAANKAQTRGWATSQVADAEATTALKSNGIKVERMPRELETRLKRLGEKFSREWVRSVGNEANTIFVPFYTQ
jgi:TRAP-type transport system periplasmic protein